MFKDIEKFSCVPKHNGLLLTVTFRKKKIDSFTGEEHYIFDYMLILANESLEEEPTTPIPLHKAKFLMKNGGLLLNFATILDRLDAGLSL